MDELELSVADPKVGLCAICRFGEAITTSKNAVFWRCRRSFEDPDFPRYPSLPKVACTGYQAPPTRSEGLH